MNKHKDKKLKAGRGTVGKAIVAGIKDRKSNKINAKVVEETSADTLQGFVLDSTEKGASIYTDESAAYQGLPNHFTVNHSVKEWVNEGAHTNGLENFWSLFKRGFHGTFHRMSKEHLHRYVAEFAGRHNIRELDTTDQMGAIFTGMIGKPLSYKALTA